MLPAYRPTIGAAWLEKGGVYVVANIRGGGEFGPEWHQAALKANRHRAYEDFIAVGEDLVRRKITSPPHLGAMGGSNGGLLMGNMLTRRPELFGAIVCGAPARHEAVQPLARRRVLDGRVRRPRQPRGVGVHPDLLAVPQRREVDEVPATLFTTSTRDDRVHPGHARKMVAKMREQGHDVVYYENIEGGHGAAADNKQAAFMERWPTRSSGTSY